MRRQAVAWRGDDAGLVDLARSYLTWIVEGSRAADMRGSFKSSQIKMEREPLSTERKWVKPHQSLT